MGGKKRFQKGGRKSKGRNTGPKLSGKAVSHLKEFGESHPAEELDGFGPTTAKQRRLNFSDRNEPLRRPEPEEESESESEEEETTPYGELLTLLSGNKGRHKQIEIESASEEDDDESVKGSDEDNNENLEVIDEDQEEEKLKDKVETNVGDNESEVPPETDDALGEETVILDEELDPDAVDTGDIDDPFVLHFERQLPEDVVELVNSGGKMYTASSGLELPVLEKLQHNGIALNDLNKGQKPVNEDTSTLLGEQRKLANIPGPPAVDKTLYDIDSLHIKTQIQPRIGITNQVALDNESCPGPLTPLQSEIMYLSSRYYDLYFPQRNRENQEAVRLAYCLHAANHIYKTRTRILHHNAKLASKTEVPEAYRDQSFVRPKVLIMVPFRDSALRIVKILLSLMLENEKGNVANKKRFVDEFSGETLFMPKTNPKPQDYVETFSGNIDDNFRIGISLTKKSIKLFTDFYSSDLIIASPLGLRVIVGAEGEGQRDYDFLSSIEVVILDQADVFLMQSWDHVIHVMKHLNLQPLTTHGTDFSRIRPWALDGLTKNYRQTLVFSSINCPELVALFARNCKNYAGLLKVINPVVKGSISHVTVQLPQVYQQFDSPSLQEMNDCRFNFFVNKVLPNFSARLMSHTLIFVSSYFDFVRLRNHFKREEVSFVQICEYTKDKKVSRARDLFFHNQNHFLLYTERAMFFRRFRLKGLGHILFYQLPQNPYFYAELCNFVQEGFQNRRVRQRKNSSVTAIYCQYDASRLAAIVGSDRASFMLSSDKNVHAFVTGEV